MTDKKPRHPAKVIFDQEYDKTRPKPVLIRFSQEELDVLNAAKGDLTIQAFIKSRLFKKKTQ